MDEDVPVLVGTLIVSPQSSFTSFITKKTSHQKHCVLYRASRHGIERLEICDQEYGKNPKIITMENCVKITLGPPPANKINIVKKSNENLTLFALNEIDLKKWIEALQSVAFADKSAAFARDNSVLEKENDLYCTSFSDGLFTVNFLSCDAPLLKNIIEPNSYTLQLTATEIQLKKFDTNGVKLIAKWPYRAIRKYGYRDGKYCFEAGRQCATGEGEVLIKYSNPMEIYRCMDAKMRSMKQLMSGDNTNNLDCSRNQFNAALSMEAGSRSPLPPSPNQNYSENNQNPKSHFMQGFISSTDSMNNLSSTAPSKPPVAAKLIPCKPPRKSIPNINVDNNIKPRSDAKPKSTSPIYKACERVVLAQIDTNDLNRCLNSIALKSSPPPPLLTSPPPISCNRNKLNLPLIADHAISPSSLCVKTPIHSPARDLPPKISPSLCIKTPIHSPANDLPPKIPSSLCIKTPIHSPANDLPPKIPARVESLHHFNHQQEDDPGYASIKNIKGAWMTLGISEPKHPENLNLVEEDFKDLPWQRSQPQKGKGSSRKVHVTVHASCDAKDIKSKNDGYDKLDFLPTKALNPASDYQTIVTIHSPPYKTQASQPLASDDYEFIDNCTKIASDNSVPPVTKAEPKRYGLIGDHQIYGMLRKPVKNMVSAPVSVPMQSKSNTIRIAAPTSADDPANHKTYKAQTYATVNKSNQV